MNIYAIPSFIAFLIILALGCFVLLSNSKAKPNRIFALLMVSIAVWCLGEFGQHVSTQAETALFWIKFSYIGAVFIVSFFVHLSFVFPVEKYSRYKKALLQFLYASSVTFVILLPTDLFIAGVEELSWGFTEKTGFAFLLENLYFIIFMAYGFITLIRSYAKELNVSKKQVTLFSFGVSLPIIGAIISTALIPLFTTREYPLATSMTIVTGIILAYTITKHKLFIEKPKIDNVYEYMASNPDRKFERTLSIPQELSFFEEFFTEKKPSIGEISKGIKSFDQKMKSGDDDFVIEASYFLPPRDAIKTLLTVKPRQEHLKKYDYLLALKYLHLGEEEEALRQMQKYDLHEAKILKARAVMQKKDYKKAIVELSFSSEGKVELSRLFWLGVVNFNERSWSDAAVSWERCLKLTKKMSWRSIIYLNLGAVEDNKNKWDDARKYYQKSLSIAEKIKNRFLIGKSLFCIADTHYRKGEYDEALGYYERSLDIANKIKDDWLISRILNGLGRISFFKAEWKKAREYWLKCIDFTQKIDDEFFIVTPIGNIGAAYAVSGEWDNALDYFRKVEEFSEKLGEESLLTTTYNNIGEVYRNKGDWKKAEEYYLRNIEISKKFGNLSSAAVTLTNLGHMFIEKKDWGKAMAYLKESLAISKEIGDKWGEAHTYKEFCIMYTNKNELDKAIEFANKSSNIASEVGDPTLQSEVNVSFGGISYMKNNFDKALEHYSKAKEVFDKVGDRNNSAFVLKKIGEVYEEIETKKAMEHYISALEIYKEIGAKREEKKTYESIEKLILKDPSLSDLLPFELPMRGHCYLIEEAKAEKSYRLFTDSINCGIEGFCMTRTYPEKIKEKYDLANTPIIWLSTTKTKGSIEPTNLAALTRLLTDFLKKEKNSIIMLDGLDYIITQNDFRTVLRFLYFLRDTVGAENSRLIVPINPKILDTKELSLLERDFEVIK